MNQTDDPDRWIKAQSYMDAVYIDGGIGMQPSLIDYCEMLNMIEDYIYIHAHNAMSEGNFVKMYTMIQYGVQAAFMAGKAACKEEVAIEAELLPCIKEL